MMSMRMSIVYGLGPVAFRSASYTFKWFVTSLETSYQLRDAYALGRAQKTIHHTTSILKCHRMSSAERDHSCLCYGAELLQRQLR